MVLRIICCLLVCLLPDPGHAQQNQDGLVTALQLAVRQHPSAKSRMEELKALGFDFESAESRRYPSLSVQASSTGSVVGSTVNSGDQYHAVVAVVRQPLWVGGRIDGGIDQAAAKLKIGKLSLLTVQRQLMENTAATYVAVRGARTKLAAAELNVQEHERLKSLISRRASGGIASQADVQLASSRLSLAEAQRIQLDAALQSALNDLLALTQQELSAAIPVNAALTVLPDKAEVAPGVEKASPLIQQRLLEVELARTAAYLTKAEMMPSLYAKFEQDVYTRTESGDVPQGTRIGLVLEGAVEGLGFSGWKRIKSSDARIVAAQRDVETARNDARRQAHMLLTDLQSQQLMQQSYASLVTSTTETLDSFMRQYDAGRKSWVDVLNTQRELSEARLSLEQAVSQVFDRKLRLAVQLGLLDVQAGVTP